MPLPVLSAGQVASNMQFTEVYASEFEGTGPGPGDGWVYDPMERALNRVGNYGQDANGNLQEDSVVGKRWAAWYNGDNDRICYRENGILKIAGYVEYASDPTRENYTHNSINYNWADRRAYTAYLVQWHRIYSQAANGGAGGQITDPASPDVYFGPGHYIECRLSVEQMRTKGFRVSLWFMPYGENAGNAYDADTGNGVEVDVFEIENWIGGGYGNNRIQSKVLGGSSGRTQDQGGGNVDLSAYNLNQGFHTVGCLWLSTGLYWFIDGVEFIRDLDNVPQEYQFLSLTRELNSGVVPATEASGNDIPSNGIKRPVDQGLYPPESAYPQLDTLEQCIAQIDYIRVWSVDGENGFFNGSNISNGETGTGGGGLVEGGTETGGGTNSGTTSLINDNARTGFSVPPPSPISAGREIQVAASIPEGDDPDDYTYSWSVVGTGVEIISGQDQYIVTISIDPTAPDQSDGRVECDINSIGPEFAFSNIAIQVTSTTASGTVETNEETEVTLQRRVGTSGFWTNGTTTTSGLTHSSTIDGLIPSTAYQFRFYSPEGVSSIVDLTTDPEPVVLSYSPIQGEYA